MNVVERVRYGRTLDGEVGKAFGKKEKQKERLVVGDKKGRGEGKRGTIPDLKKSREDSDLSLVR